MANSKVSLSDVYEITSRIEDKLDKLESRITLLEVWRAEVVGKLSIITGAIAVIISLSVDWVKKRLNL